MVRTEMVAPKVPAKSVAGAIARVTMAIRLTIQPGSSGLMPTVGATMTASIAG